MGLPMLNSPPAGVDSSDISRSVPASGKPCVSSPTVSTTSLSSSRTGTIRNTTVIALAICGLVQHKPVTSAILVLLLHVTSPSAARSNTAALYLCHLDCQTLSYGGCLPGCVLMAVISLTSSQKVSCPSALLDTAVSWFPPRYVTIILYSMTTPPFHFRARLSFASPFTQPYLYLLYLYDVVSLSHHTSYRSSPMSTDT